MIAYTTARPLCGRSIGHTLDTLRARGAVRLDDEEAAALAAALDGVIAYGVELFGSRTDAAARGGDVDVLVLSPEPPFATARRITTRFFGRCEEKLDVVVVNPDALSASQQAFIEGASRVRLA